MNRYFTVETENRKQFYQVPKQFMVRNSKYFEMTSDSKLLYGILSDRNSLSIKNKWIDDEKRIYFIATIENLMELLGWGNQKVIKHLKELRKYELLISVQKGQGKPSWHYLLQIEVEEVPETLDCVNKCENDISTNSTSTFDEMLKSHGNNTNINNTNINNTESIEKKSIKENNLSCSVLSNLDLVDKNIKDLLLQDPKIKTIDFNKDIYYSLLLESIILTRIQDNVDVLGFKQWNYLKNTLLNKLKLIKSESDLDNIYLGGNYE